MLRLPSIVQKSDNFSAWAKAGIVIAGYLGAILLAIGVVAVHVALTSGPDRDASSGMHAFGDALLFLVIFGLVSIIPTALAVFFLRRNRLFWATASALALVVAGAGLLSVLSFVRASQGSVSGSTMSVWEAVAVPVIFISPFLAASFGLAALAAPGARFKWLLGLAAAGAGAASLHGFGHWLAPLICR